MPTRAREVRLRKTCKDANSGSQLHLVPPVVRLASMGSRLGQRDSMPNQLALRRARLVLRRHGRRLDGPSRTTPRRATLHVRPRVRVEDLREANRRVVRKPQHRRISKAAVDTLSKSLKAKRNGKTLEGGGPLWPAPSKS